MSKDMFSKALWRGRRADRFMAMTGVLHRAHPNCVFYPHSNLQHIFPMSTTRHLADLLSTSRDLPFFLLLCTGDPRFKPHRDQPPPRNVKVVLLQRKGVLFLPVPIRQAGSCPSGFEMGSPQDLSLLLEIGGHKEKEKRLKRRLRQMLHPTAETPARGSRSGASCPQSQQTNC